MSLKLIVAWVTLDLLWRLHNLKQQLLLFSDDNSSLLELFMILVLVWSTVWSEPLLITPSFNGEALSASTVKADYCTDWETSWPTRGRIDELYTFVWSILVSFMNDVCSEACATFNKVIYDFSLLWDCLSFSILYDIPDTEDNNYSFNIID